MCSAKDGANKVTLAQLLCCEVESVGLKPERSRFTFLADRPDRGLPPFVYTAWR